MTEYDEQHDNEEGQENSAIREVREHAKSLEANLKEKERQISVYQTFGDKLSEKQAKALISSHDGEWDSDALRETAAELGFVPADTDDNANVEGGQGAAETDQTDQAREAAHAQQRGAQAMGGGQPPPAPSSPDEKLKSLKEKVSRYQNPNAVQGLREEVLAAIREHPNLEFGNAEVIDGGNFSPL